MRARAGRESGGSRTKDKTRRRPDEEQDREMAEVIPFDQRDGLLWYDGKLVA